MQTTVTSHIRKGLFIAAALIILNVIAQVLHQSFTVWHRLSFIVIFVLSIIISSIIFKKQSKETLPYNSLAVHNFKTSAVVICIFFIYLILAIYILFPQQFNFLIEQTVQQAKLQGKSDAEIQQQIPVTKKVIAAYFLSTNLMLLLLTGLISSLIGAAIAKQIN